MDHTAAHTDNACIQAQTFLQDMKKGSFTTAFPTAAEKRNTHNSWH